MGDCSRRSLGVLAAGMGFLVGGLRLGPCQTSSMPAGSAAVYRVAGTVVSKADGRPLARARVVLADVKDTRKSEARFSTDDGRFEFTGVPAGKYSLGGAGRGFLPASYDQHEQFSTAIVTGAGLDTENLTLKLSPAAVIVGRVLDESGDPVRRAQVMLYRVNHGLGVRQVQLFRSEQTNDLGWYEFAGLIPGTYYVSAAATPWYAVYPPRADTAASTQVDPALNVAYPLTYYADTTDPDSATAITVRDGGQFEIEIHLTPVAALHLIFHSPDSNSNVSPQLRGAGPTWGSSASPIAGLRTQSVSPGVWELSGIPPGKYNIEVPGAGGLGQLGAVDLESDGQEVSSSGGEVSKVTFSLRMIAQGAIPPGLGVFLRSDRGIGAWRPMNAGGQDQPLEVAPGRYEIMVGGTQKAYSIASISASGCQVSGHTVNLPPGEAAIALTVVQGTARVAGVVKRGTQPIAGAMVVLVPKDPADNRTLFRRDQSDLDGTFALNSVSPGKYMIVAIEDGWDLDWSEPEVISGYLKRGQPVEIRSLQSRSIDLAEPIEVQPK